MGKRAKTRTMELTDGRTVEIIPGLIDTDAKWLYRRGQSLAFAVELALRTRGKVAVLTDGEGELIHAYSLKKGLLQDIDGSSSAKELKTAVREANRAVVRGGQSGRLRSLKLYSPKELRTAIGFQPGSEPTELEGIIAPQPQDLVLAGCFAESYIRENSAL